MEEPWKNKEWLLEQYVNQQKSMDQIANELDINSGTVYYYIDKYDINTRDRIQEVKRSCRVEYANYYTNNKGYPLWKTGVGNAEEDICYVSRLLAVAEYGFDSVVNREVHHKNSIPWDNRPENIEPVTRKQHAQKHSDEYDCYKHRKTPYRDKETLEKLYAEQEMSTHEIGDELGVAASTINRWLRRFNISLRPDHCAIKDINPANKS